ncbi:acyltransferase [Novosphingobium flavum]|uniref:Acyltransferase n=1 Tax=Novosphingobium flavum TaxID=1778672 RepID=A0A7X1KN00_9SPHN|nr:acyltransferase [Novosphingobium flavum]MBC2666898.1 acyltransferase [Novosphingobium flavum]
MSAEPPRLARLDGMRGLAAFGVAFFYHARSLFPEGALDSGNRLLDWPHVYGWLFVDLFFVLSGYVFAHAYLGRDALRSEADLTDFAVARFARLYPLHFVMLLVAVLAYAGKAANTPLAFLAHLFMLQAMVQPVAGTFIGPAWSLSVEVVCYLLFAMAAVRGPRTLVGVTGAAVALGAALLLRDASTEAWSADNFPRGFLGFFLGQALWHLRARLARVPGWALLAVMAFGAWLPPEGPWGAILPFALLVFPAALLFGLRQGLLECRPLIWLGDRSYAIYLIHLVPRDLFLAWHGPLAGAGLGGIVLGHVVFAAVSLLLADLAFRWIEMPARRLIRAAWSQRARRPVTA